jgi:Domain of unknown function (DUF3303)
MKFIAFWEMKPEDAGKVILKFSKRQELGLKTLYGPCHIGGQAKGFTIFEADDPGVLTNYSSYYTPELTMVIYPIDDSKAVVESWLKHHK